MRYPKRSQNKYAKSRYRVRNWADYASGLQRRGGLTVWLSDTALKAWRALATGRPGGQPTYADLAIELASDIGSLPVGGLHATPRTGAMSGLGRCALNARSGSVARRPSSGRPTDPKSIESPLERGNIRLDEPAQFG